jgi:adenylosuccinate synthase
LVDVSAVLRYPCHQAVGTHLQEVGKEYGTTTGRRRRCGWLDLVVLKHSCLINGYDAINITKLDVLDSLEEIKVAVAYKANGCQVAGFPGMHVGWSDLGQVTELNAQPI